MKNILTLTYQIKCPYESYDKKHLDKKAEKSIIFWLEDTLKSECSYVPMYVEKDENGSFIEDCTSQITFKRIK
jgi:hypothetical protein